MPNYSNGKIYKITGGGLTYIGSTTQKLSYRLSSHRAEKKSKPYSNVSSFQILDFDDCCITLIEDVPCERREQLLMRERHWIENTECVNKVVPLRTSKEYREINKDVLNLKHKEWYNNNKDKIKEYYEANKEVISKKHTDYYYENKEHLNKLHKKWISENRDKIKETTTKYIENNIDHVLKVRKEYYDKNKDLMTIKHREYCNKNKEKIAEIAKRCREKNLEKVKEKKRLYHQENKEKLKEKARLYYLRNKEKICQKESERRALKKLQKETA